MKGFFNSRHTNGVRKLGKKTDPAPPDANPWPKERFREIYTQNYDDLWLYCLRRSVDASQAEEVLANTFTVAWQKLDEVPSGKEARPWLFAVARNNLRNTWRKSKRRSELTQMLLNEVATNTQCLDPAEIATEHATELLRAFGSLKIDDQELLQLTYWESLSHSEIATILDCSVNAVGIRIYRARERLAKKINHDLLKGSEPSEHAGSDKAVNTKGGSDE